VKFFLYKLFQYFLAFICIITLNFFLVHLMPGDPLVHLLGEEGYLYINNQTPREMEKLKAKYGLDGPLYKQYTAFLANTMKADLGWSYHYSRPVFQVILFRLKWTLILLMPSIFISTLLGAWLGAVAGWRSDQKTDRILTPFFLFIYATPSYGLGLLFLLVFGFYADLFPLGGMAGQNLSGIAGLADTLSHMALPMAVLICHNTAYNYPIMRSAVMQVKTEDYILTAVSKGLKPRQVLFCHVLKNALPPYATVIALNFGFMVGGALLVEIIFSWQGMGALMYDALLSRDYPLLSGSLFILTICVILANALSDLFYAYIDPRIRGRALDV